MNSHARKVFKRDRRRSFNDILVYEFLEDELDDETPLECKLWWISYHTGIKEPHVSAALKNLTEWGYLKDHRASINDPWLLTIVKVMPASAA